MTESWTSVLAGMAVKWRMGTEYRTALAAASYPLGALAYLQAPDYCASYEVVSVDGGDLTFKAWEDRLSETAPPFGAISAAAHPVGTTCEVEA